METKTKKQQRTKALNIADVSWCGWLCLFLFTNFNNETINYGKGD